VSRKNAKAFSIFENPDFRSQPQTKREVTKDTMPVLKREVIKMADSNDSPPFDLDDESLNPFLIQLALSGNPVPATIQEDNHSAGFRSNRAGPSVRKP